MRHDEAGTVEAAPDDPLAPTIKVMAVDDDAFARDLLKRLLERVGIQVVSHASAAELLADDGLPSATVLLLDIKMPRMSGLELQEVLSRRGIDVPIIFISGAADLAMAVTAMRNGAVDFIEKPYEVAGLIERVRRAAAGGADRIPTVQRQTDPTVLADFETLTPREREVFDLLVTGMSSKVIARELGGSFRTIEVHRAQIMRKMKARHLPELVRLSIESLQPRGARVR